MAGTWARLFDVRADLPQALELKGGKGDRHPLDAGSQAVSPSGNRRLYE